MGRKAAFVALALTLAGCRTADFDLETPERTPRLLTRDVRLGLDYGPEVPHAMRAALEKELFNDPRVKAIDVQLRTANYDHEVQIDLMRKIDARGTNFLVAWPGFLVFAPVWHRFDWDYRLHTAVEVRPRGEEQVYAANAWDHYDVSHATGLQMVQAELGFLTYSLQAFLVGLFTTIESPNNRWFDDDFAEVERERWARGTAALIFEALAREEQAATAK